MTYPGYLSAILAQGFIFFISLLFPSNACARFYPTLFWMNEIPQSRYGHIAHFPEYQMYIGLPLISSLYGNVSNSGYSLGDIMRPGSGNERYWDISHFTGQLIRYNYTMADLHIDMGSFGFRHKRNFYSFAITHKATIRAGYTPDLARVALHGSNFFPAQTAPVANLNNLALKSMHYREFSVGAARQVNRDLTIGFRTKILTGLSGVFINNSDIELQPDPTNGNTLLNANIMIYASPQDTSGMFSGLSGFLTDYLYRGSNLGFSVDMGIAFKPAQKTTIAFSLLDAGFIRWGNSVRNLEVTGTSEFDGIPVEDIFEGNIISNVELFIDTTSYLFTSNSSFNKFWSGMQPSLLASLSHDIGVRQQLSVFSQFSLFSGKVFPVFSVSYHVRPGRHTGLTMSYSYIHHGYGNAGIGFFVNIGSMQLYLVSDNILAPLFPYQARMANIHMGVNLIPSEKRTKRKKYKDIPGLYCWD